LREKEVLRVGGTTGSQHTDRLAAHLPRAYPRFPILARAARAAPDQPPRMRTPLWIDARYWVYLPNVTPASRAWGRRARRSPYELLSVAPDVVGVDFIEARVHLLMIEWVDYCRSAELGGRAAVVPYQPARLPESGVTRCQPRGRTGQAPGSGRSGSRARTRLPRGGRSR
jgi:hypothetical protein